MADKGYMLLVNTLFDIAEETNINTAHKISLRKIAREFKKLIKNLEKLTRYKND